MSSRIDPIARAYAVLELRRGCSREEIRRQYHQLVKRWHPDQYMNDRTNYEEAEQRLRQIVAAYDVLRGARP